MLKRSNDVISVNFLNKVSGTKMCKVGSVTEVKLLKKSRIDKSPIPSKFDGLMKLSFFVASVGHNYETIVQNRVNKFGTGEGYIAQPSTVSNVFDKSTNGIMRVGLRSNDQFYVRLFFNTSPNRYSEVIYINGSGKIIVPTKEEVEAYFPIQSENKKQSDHGLDEESYVNVREFKAENILYFQCGDATWNNLGDSFMKLFNLECV